MVEEIEYDFCLAIKKGKHYLGQAVIKFYSKTIPADGELFLDFQAIAISELAINGKLVSDCFADQRIKLQSPHVVVGWNTVSLRYLNLYNTNRVGLHSYVDPSDNEQYLHTQFEVFHCYHVFPVFDQPSLKAKMTLAVTCPEDWSAVGNSIE